MLGQTFSPLDLPLLLVLILVEGVLSIDNAIAIAAIAQPLPEKERSKALFFGLFISIFLRLFAILGVSFLLSIPWIQLLAGGYLILLSCKYFLKKRRRKRSNLKHTSFLSAVFQIECTDCLFAIDSILTGVAFIGYNPSQGHIHPKIWIVYAGCCVGIVAMRFTARFLLLLIKRFPALERSAYFIIGWVGLKLIVHAFWISIPIWVESLFWAGTAYFIAGGFGLLKSHKRGF